MSMSYGLHGRKFNIYISGMTEDIVISAPRYVRVNQRFELNCSSFVVPRKKTAEFLIDDITHTNIRSHENVCYFNYLPTTSIVAVFETEVLSSATFILQVMFF
jgi:hypothetical protein